MALLLALEAWEKAVAIWHEMISEGDWSCQRLGFRAYGYWRFGVQGAQTLAGGAYSDAILAIGN